MEWADSVQNLRQMHGAGGGSEAANLGAAGKTVADDQRIRPGCPDSRQEHAFGQSTLHLEFVLLIAEGAGQAAAARVQHL
jgi:hypothetical protein